MTQREQKLLWILLAVGAVLVPAALLYFVVLEPYWTYKRELAALEDEVDENEVLIAQRLKDKRQMERWRMLSLPGPDRSAKGDKNAGKGENYSKAELTY